MDTSNATEAWILLAIVAPNIQGHNPERVSKLLLANLKYDMVSLILDLLHNEIQFKVYVEFLFDIEEIAENIKLKIKFSIHHYRQTPSKIATFS